MPKILGDRWKEIAGMAIMGALSKGKSPPPIPVIKLMESTFYAGAGVVAELLMEMMKENDEGNLSDEAATTIWQSICEEIIEFTSK